MGVRVDEFFSRLKRYDMTWFSRYKGPIDYTDPKTGADAMFYILDMIKSSSPGRAKVVISRALITIAARLIELGYDINKPCSPNKGTPDKFRKNPLMWSCIGDNVPVEMVKLLIISGAKVNAQDSYGHTALYYAIQSGFSAALEELLKAGASLEIPPGWDPVQEVLNNRNHPHSRGRMLKLLMRDKDFDPFTMVDYGLPDAIREYNGNINITDSEGKSLLHRAMEKIIARENPLNVIYYDVIEALIENGINTNAQDREGKTAIMYAAINRINIRDSIRLLITKTNLNLLDRRGMTVLHYAAQFEDYEYIQAIMKAGANVNSVSRDGRTPLDILMTSPGRETGFTQSIIKKMHDYGAERMEDLEEEFYLEYQPGNRFLRR